MSLKLGDEMTVMVTAIDEGQDPAVPAGCPGGLDAGGSDGARPQAEPSTRWRRQAPPAAEVEAAAGGRAGWSCPKPLAARPQLVSCFRSSREKCFALSEAFGLSPYPLSAERLTS